MKYKLLNEHSNDLAIEVYGKTKLLLFENALNAMSELLGCKPYGNQLEHLLSNVSGTYVVSLDDTFVLHDILSEALATIVRTNTCQWNFKITKLSTYELRTYLTFTYCDGLFKPEVEIKAVTYCDMNVHFDGRDKLWKTKIVFDT
jgi:SHS2 domain-containing protein